MAKSSRNNRYGNKRHSKKRNSPDIQVINLSQVNLKRAQTRVLNKGLGFAPTTFEKSEKLIDMVELPRMNRQIRWNFIYGLDGPSRDEKEFQVPSKKEPPIVTRLSYVEPFIRQFAIDLQAQIKCQIRKHRNLHKYNISSNETKALHGLAAIPNIVIKPADKGCAIVVMDKARYLNEIWRMLDNDRYYERLQESIMPDTISKVRTMVLHMYLAKLISRKVYEFLREPNEALKMHKFYGLPKVNKARTTWPLPNQPALRPITTSTGSILSALSSWVDFNIQPYVTKMLKDSLVKDTYDFIDRLKNLELPRDAEVILVAADVKDLYTNIPHDEGIEAVLAACEQDGIIDARLKPHLKKAMDLILKRNDFTVAGRHYRQKKGIAMGTNAAPAIANIYMEMIDKVVCNSNPLFYARFIDDLILVWDKNRRADLDLLKSAINTCNTNIELVFTESDTSNTFLDVELLITDRIQREGKLDWKVYFKPTDTRQLLHRDSCHPKHTFAGIIKSQMFRYKRLCSRTADFLAVCDSLARILHLRGYSMQQLIKTKLEVSEMSVELKRDVAVKEPSLYLIMQWDMRLYTLPRWVAQTWKQFWDLHRDEIDRKVPSKMTVSFKRATNLQQRLVRAVTLT
jgi:hypothetical protein